MRLLTRIIILNCLLYAAGSLAEDITGKWKTIDDETGKAKSIVEIYKKGNHYEGKVLQLLLKPNDTLCDKCNSD